MGETKEYRKLVEFRKKWVTLTSKVRLTSMRLYTPEEIDFILSEPTFRDDLNFYSHARLNKLKELLQRTSPAKQIGNIYYEECNRNDSV